MRFTLDGLEVFFPYDYLYKEQYDYMLHLKKALDERGHFLLEMPTGTGKTVCLIALITSYQFQFPKTGKLIYCTRTVPEMYKCMEEIKKVIAYRTKLLGPAGGKVLAVCLSSRRNMCMNPRVLEEGDREAVDSLCRNMTASWVRAKAYGTKRGEKIVNAEVQNPNYQLCEFYEKYDQEGGQAAIPQGVFSLDDLKDYGKGKGWCPYFMTRRFIHHANILVYNYQYVLDPRVSNIVSQELEAECIVVFDEAHNIDNVCIEALSVIVDKKMIENSIRNVNELQRKVVELKASDSQRLQREYNDLLRGLSEHNRRGPHQSSSSTTSVVPSNPQPNSSSGEDHSATLATFADGITGNPVIPKDLLEEAIPGNIRKAEHFLAYLKKIILYLKPYFQEKGIENKDVENNTPLSFLHQLQEKTGLERKPLRFTHTRMNSLLRTLEITALDDFLAVQSIANFVTLVSTYLEGFAVIYEPKGSIVSGITEPLVHLACLDASIAIKPVFEKFQSVIITSGTLSPIDFYPKLLNFKPILRVSLPMSTFRPCLLPLIVTRGSDQIAISTRFELRKDIAVIRNYGHLLLEVVASVPDGVCCFFTSYQYMEYVISVWDKMNILNQIMEYKLIYLETKDVVETTLALENYRRACDCGRGAVFFSIARGKVAEGIDFDRHYGRCVLLFGIPYQYTLSHVLKARLNFMREKYQIRDNDFLTFDALRQSAQCIGRVIRSKTDYGIVILADSRYNRQDKRSKLPPWIVQFIRESCMNLSTDVAIDQMKHFLKQAGQPIEEKALRTILLDEQQIFALNQSQQYSYGGLVASPLTIQLIKKEPNTTNNNNNNHENEEEILKQEIEMELQRQEEEKEQLDEFIPDPVEEYLLKNPNYQNDLTDAMDVITTENNHLKDIDIPRIHLDPQKNNKYASLFLFSDD